jgi:hypothetical protein
VRPSTLIELCGFGLLSFTVWRFNTFAGGLVAGFCLLLIGYATEDPTAGLSLARVVAPITARRALHRARRQARRERKEKKPRRDPHEVTVRVRGD